MSSMPDLLIVDDLFSSTQVSIQSCTKKGNEFFQKQFGDGAVSVDMPRSNAIWFKIFAYKNGITVSWERRIIK